MALERAEIEKRLQNHPKELVVAFAVRAALRVFPLIAYRGHVDFWIENKGAKNENDRRKEHFGAVWDAIAVASGFDTRKGGIKTAAAAAADSAYTAAAAAAAADSAYAAAADSAYAAAADSAYAAAAAVEKDLAYLDTLISEEGNESNLVKQFYQQPLWDGKKPEWFSENLSRLATVLEELGLTAAVYRPYLELIREGFSFEANTTKVESKGERELPKEDAYGREVWAEALAQLLYWRAISAKEKRETNKNKAKPQSGNPLTIGLFAHWGLGKTVFTNYLFQALKLFGERTKGKRIGFITATFNAWEYHDAENYRAAMAHTVLEGLKQAKNWWQKRRMFFRFYWKLLWKRHALAGFLMAVSFLIGLLSVAATGLFGGKGIWFFLAAFLLLSYHLSNSAFSLMETPTLTKLFHFFSTSNYYKKIGELAYLKQELALLLKAGLRSDEYLLLVIDDLDRCHWQHINKTFDTVRLLYDLEKVFVLIAIDERIAYAAVAHRFDKERDYNAEIERDFLAKIIELPISLQPPDKAGHRKNIEVNLFERIKVEEKEDGNTTNGKEAAKGNAPPTEVEPESPQSTDPKDAEESSKETPEEQAPLEEDLEWLASERDCFEEYTFACGIVSPRVVKRLYNAFSLLMMLEGKLDKPTEEREKCAEVLAVLLAWCEKYPADEFSDFEDYVKKESLKELFEGQDRERLYGLVRCFTLPYPKRDV